jgi:hypothetical protein
MMPAGPFEIGRLVNNSVHLLPVRIAEGLSSQISLSLNFVKSADCKVFRRL